MKLSIKLAVACFVGAALFALPAMSAPFAVFPNGVSIDSQALQAQARAVARGGAYRGAAVRRGGAYRGAAVYRGGAAVRRGAVVGGAVWAGATTEVAIVIRTINIAAGEPTLLLVTAEAQS